MLIRVVSLFQGCLWGRMDRGYLPQRVGCGEHILRRPASCDESCQHRSGGHSKPVCIIGRRGGSRNFQSARAVEWVWEAACLNGLRPHFIFQLKSSPDTKGKVSVDLQAE